MSKKSSSDNNQEHLQSLGIFAGSIAHDLNNMLTGILGHISLLRLQLGEQGISKESLQAIEDAARRSAHMTKQILEFARGMETKPIMVNMTAVVADAVSLLKASKPSGVTLNFSTVDEKLFVMGDECQLGQIVLNLIVNAYEAFDKEGSVEVSFDQVALGVQEEDKELGLAAGSYVRLLIRDNGTGIPEQVKPRIFEPFFTTKLHRGTGLGLATVFSIVKSHSGAIIVDSEEGRGTQFQIFFPLCVQDKAEIAAPKTSGAIREQLPQGNETILIVDDEESVRTVMQRSLQHLGYSVEVAQNGIEALKVYCDDPSKFSLIILDMIMPSMAGDEVFFKLKELNNSVPVLMASGYSSDAKTKSVLHSGGRGFIQKPFAVDELAREVRRCIDGE